MTAFDKLIKAFDKHLLNSIIAYVKLNYSFIVTLANLCNHARLLLVEARYLLPYHVRKTQLKHVNQLDDFGVIWNDTGISYI